MKEKKNPVEFIQILRELNSLRLQVVEAENEEQLNGIQEALDAIENKIHQTVNGLEVSRLLRTLGKKR